MLTQASAVASLLDDAVYGRPFAATIVEWGAAILVVAFAAFALPASGIGIGALGTLLIIAILVIGEIGLLSSAQIWARLMLPCIGALAGLKWRRFEPERPGSGAVTQPATTIPAKSD